MYYVNKIVGWVMSPMGMMFLGLAVGAGLRRFSRYRRLGAWIAGLTLAFTWILGCGLTTRIVGLPLEGEERLHVFEGEAFKGSADEECRAISLLGGGMGAHQKCGRAEMFSGADRVWTAARLWHATGRRLPIFCSGGGVEKSALPLLVDLGVPREAIVTLPQPRNTEEEARTIRDRLNAPKASAPKVREGEKVPGTGDEKARGHGRIFLVTSAWHMPRAKMLFERAGLAVTPVPTDYEMHFVAEMPLEVGDFFPNADALLRNSLAVKEWVARFCYWLNGFKVSGFQS